MKPKAFSLDFWPSPFQPCKPPTSGQIAGKIDTEKLLNAPLYPQEVATPPSTTYDLRTGLREVEERIGITQDRIDGGSLSYPRSELLVLRQQLHDQAEHLQQSIDAHARALETPPPPPQLSPEAPPVPLPPPQPPEPIAASYLYETSGGDGEDEEPEWLTTASELMEQQLGYGPRPGRTTTSSRSPSPVASWPDERLPRTHDRRGWRSRAPWRHADEVRSRCRRDECGGEGLGAPCIRVAYGEGMGRSRSGPASILSVVSPARPPTQ